VRGIGGGKDRGWFREKNRWRTREKDREEAGRKEKERRIEGGIERDFFSFL
jgi:hypothetical protein